MNKVFWKLKIEGKYGQDELEYIAEQIIQGNYWGTIYDRSIDSGNWIAGLEGGNK